MTTISQHNSGTETRQTPIGAKLQSARESLQLERKDAAAQLRLNENVIHMIETNSFPDDMPQIFIRGYIRSYGKLLQLSDEDVRAATEIAKPQAPAASQPVKAPAPAEPTSHQKYLVQGLSACILFMVVWMLAAWWHGRTSIPAPDHVTVAQLAEPANTAAAPAGVSVQLAKPAELIPAAALAEAGKTAGEPDTEDR